MDGPTPDLTIHDIVVKSSPTFSPSGAIGQQVVVTYYVGDHGPFTLQYAPKDFSPEKARAAMEHQQVELRRLITGQ